jgi:hypothetical protein
MEHTVPACFMKAHLCFMFSDTQFGYGFKWIVLQNLFCGLPLRFPVRMLIVGDHYRFILQDQIMDISWSDVLSKNSYQLPEIFIVSVQIQSPPGLVVRVPGYRSIDPEFDSRRYQIF